MKPESLVPTRETCIALKEAGWDAETHFLWHKGHPFGSLMVPYLTTRPRPTSEYFIAWAPTLGEILEQFANSGYCASAGNVGTIYLASVTASRPGMVPVFETSDRPHTNPAEAAARLWIKVKEGR